MTDHIDQACGAVQAWQLGLQQGIQGAQASQQKGSGQLDGAAGPAQSALVMEQLQRLGLFADGGGNLNPGQLQGLMAMLSKQGGEMLFLSQQQIPYLLHFCVH